MLVVYHNVCKSSHGSPVETECTQVETPQKSDSQRYSEDSMLLENMPLSGYALCYGPLALIIIGFIVFAAMTDADARRPYLRQTDPRPEAERGSDPVVEVSAPLSAETPAGARVTLLPPDSSGASGTAA